jgi:hypothetical protein
MGKRIRTVLAVVGVAALAGLQAPPAQAAVVVPESGLTLFEGAFAAVLLHVAEPDGACLTMPPAAASLTGERIVAQVSAFTGPGCTGLQQNLGTFRTFTAGKYRSFRAYSF